MSRDPVYEARLARAYREMEGPIEDLRRATIVLETMHGDSMEPTTLVKVPSTHRAYLLTDDQEAGFAYSVSHVSDLARKLVEDYDAKISGARAAREMREQVTPQIEETPTESVGLLELEGPLRTAIGLAKALRLMAANPVGHDVEAEPVFVLGRDIEAALKTLEERWTGLVQAGQPS